MKIALTSFLCFLIFINISMSDDITGFIKSRVDDSPIIGASIRIANTNHGAKSKENGSFIIKNTNLLNADLIITMVGFKTEKVYWEKGNPLPTIYLDENPFQTDELVVSGNKRSVAPQDVPISIAKVQSRDILDLGISRGEDMVRNVPGIEVRNDNLSIRGSSGYSFGVGSRVLILIDGMPMLSADNGSSNMEAVPAYSIKEIEIIKGGGSALYGNGALGGVINILTDDFKNDFGLKIYTNTGLYTTPRFVNWQRTDKDYYYSENIQALLYGGTEKFSGMFSLNGIYDDSWRDYDKKGIITLFSKGAYKINQKTQIDLFLSTTNTKRDDWVYWNSLDSATFPPAGTDKDVELISNKITSGINFLHLLNENTFINLKSSMFLSKFETSHDKSSLEYRGSTANSFSSEVIVSSTPTNYLTITSGLNATINNVDSKTYDNHTQSIFAAYSQVEIKAIENITLTAGVRADLESADDLEKNWQFSPKIGFTYNPTSELSCRMSLGSGYRAPSVAERFASVDFQGFEVRPNIEIKPERSLSAEAGLSWITSKIFIPMKFDISVFNNDMYDLIEPTFDENDNAVIIFDNVTKARISGIEAGIAFLFGKIGVFETNLTLMSPIDLETKKNLNYRSEVLFFNKLSLNYRNFSFGANYRYISKIKSIDDRLKIEIKDATMAVDAHITDCYIAYKFKPNNKNTFIPFKVSLNCDNLFDYYYTDMVGNLAMTRKVKLLLEFDVF